MVSFLHDYSQQNCCYPEPVKYSLGSLEMLFWFVMLFETLIFHVAVAWPFYAIS